MVLSSRRMMRLLQRRPGCCSTHFHAVYCCVLALLCAIHAQAQEEPEFSADAMRADVTFLADDLLGGREPGTAGHEIAARYVAAKFTALGLAPAGDEGTWFQSVRLQEQTLDPAAASLTLDGTQRWTHGTNVILTASQLATTTSIEAPVVFVGFGIDAPEHGFDDYRGLNVRGKIVATLIGTPRGTPSELGAHLNSSKERFAQQRGAIGMILLDTRTVRSLFPWRSRLENDASPRVTWVDASGQPVVAAPGIRATAAVDESVARELFARTKQTLDEVLDIAERPDGRPRGFDLKTTAKIEWRVTRRTRTSPNVLGLLHGSDARLRDEVVIMMAHLDHVGKRPAENGDDIVNGAMDNAAGVATMLEVARAFALGPVKPRRSLLFLAVTGEEYGLLGTEHFAHQPTVPRDRIVAAVNVDVPILTYQFDTVIAFGAEHSTLREAALKAAATAGVELSPDPMPEQGMFTRSDHYALVKQGVPSLFLATGQGKGSEQAWQDYLQHHYHRPSDDSSQPFDWRAAARFARINWLLMKDIANDPARPRWHDSSFFGRTFSSAASATHAPLRRPVANDDEAGRHAAQVCEVSNARSGLRHSHDQLEDAVQRDEQPRRHGNGWEH